MRFAIKRLTRSDLTFFEAQYRRQNAGNQKSINLNREVFIDELYPELPEVLADQEGGAEVRLRVSGPGAGYPDIQVVRKIIKNDGYKNYRLNGEFVRNPEDATDRFEALAKDDLALMAFQGAARPTAVRLFVIAAENPDDAALHRALTPLVVRKSMASVGRAALATVIAAAPPFHPVHDLFLEPVLADDLADAALGDADAVRRLVEHPGRRRVDAQQLAQARRAAERLGQDGEALVHTVLMARVSAGELSSAVWAARENAISPWDFEIRSVSGLRTLIEVKSTAAGHDRPFHISTAELQIAASDAPYELWRVSGLGDDGAQLQTCNHVRAEATAILATCGMLPSGVRPDSFTIDPALLTWSEPVFLARPAEEEDDGEGDFRV